MKQKNLESMTAYTYFFMGRKKLKCVEKCSQFKKKHLQEQKKIVSYQFWRGLGRTLMCQEAKVVGGEK
jgi:hypothetical protein